MKHITSTFLLSFVLVTISPIMAFADNPNGNGHGQQRIVDNQSSDNNGNNDNGNGHGNQNSNGHGDNNNQTDLNFQPHGQGEFGSHPPFASTSGRFKNNFDNPHIGSQSGNMHGEGREHGKFGADFLEQFEHGGTSSASLPKGLAIKLAKLEIRQASGSSTLKRHAVFGIITVLGNNTITIAQQNHQEKTWTITTDSQTIFQVKNDDTATFSDLTVGERIAAVGIPQGDALVATRIHIIPGLAKGVFEKNPMSTPSGSVSITPVVSVTATPSVTITTEPTILPSDTPTEVPQDTLTPTP